MRMIFPLADTLGPFPRNRLAVEATEVRTNRLISTPCHLAHARTDAGGTQDKAGGHFHGRQDGQADDVVRKLMDHAGDRGVLINGDDTCIVEYIAFCAGPIQHGDVLGASVATATMFRPSEDRVRAFAQKRRISVAT